MEKEVVQDRETNRIITYISILSVSSVVYSMIINGDSCAYSGLVANFDCVRRENERNNSKSEIREASRALGRKGIEK